MKKGDILKIAAILIIPGGIPAFLGYMLYKNVKKGDKNAQTDVSTDTQNSSESK